MLESLRWDCLRSADLSDIYVLVVCGLSVIGVRAFFVRDISWSLDVMRLPQTPAAHQNVP